MASAILIFLPLILIAILLLRGYKKTYTKNLAYLCVGLFVLSILIWFFTIATGVKDDFCEFNQSCISESHTTFCEFIGTCFDFRIESDDTEAEFFVNGRHVGNEGVCISNVKNGMHRISVRKNNEIESVVFKGGDGGATPQLVPENDGKTFGDIVHGFYAATKVADFNVISEPCVEI